MSARQIAYRIKSEGKAEVVADAREVGEAFRASYVPAVAGADQAGAAADRLRAKYERMAAAARASAEAGRAQAGINDTLGVRGPSSGAAAASAAVFIEDDDQERRARALKAAIDPLSAAQDRLNAELREYQMLADAGKISTAELAQAQSLARGKFDETSLAIVRQEKGLSRMALQGRLNLARQGADVFTTAAMGMNPGMIAIQQGPQILEAMSQAGIKASGSMLMLGGAVTAVAAGVVVLGAAWMRGEAAALSFERAATGLGRTSGITAHELEAIAISAAHAADISTKSAREMAVAYVSTGKIGGAVIGDLIEITKDYAAFMGMDVPDATKALAKAMAEPDKAARDMTRAFGLLDQKTLDHIDSLVKLGQQQEAQKILLAELTEDVGGFANKIGDIESAWDAVARATSNAFDELGRYLYRTRDERIAELQGQLSRPTTGMTARMSFRNPVKEREELDRLLAERTAAEARETAAAEEARRNQADQEAKDRADKAKKEADKARSAAERAQREAEREAREQRARERREEDRQATIDLEVARANNDYEGIQRLEDEAAVRQRIRQLVDDETDAEGARAKALAEQARLAEAREVVQEREVARARTTSEIDIMRAAGEERFARSAERRVELAARIEFYQQRGKDLVTAEAMATAELADLDEARAQSAERRLAAQQRAWDLELARARGDEVAVRRGERDAWIERRAREIESDPDRPLNFGEGDAQAIREWGELWSAEAEGRRRDWAKGFASDIRRSGLREALGNQLESAADRFLDKLIDGLLDIDWASFLGGGSGGGFNLGSIISGGLDFLSGSPAAPAALVLGTPAGKGDAQALQQAIAAGAGAKDSTAAAGPWSFTFAPVLHAEGAGPREVDALSAKLDQMAASLRAEIPQIVNDGVSRRTIRGLV